MKQAILSLLCIGDLLVWKFSNLEICQFSSFLETPGQNFWSLTIMVWMFRCCEDAEQKDHLIIELIINEGVCRTAPATPGLLIIYFQSQLNYITVLPPLHSSPALAAAGKLLSSGCTAGLPELGCRELVVVGRAD